MTQAALAFGIQRPSTLDEALNVIERLSGAVASWGADRVDAQRGPTPHSREWNRTIDSLVMVRRAIKDGRNDDALYELEKALSFMDSGWGCRA